MLVSICHCWFCLGFELSFGVFVNTFEDVFRLVRSKLSSTRLAFEGKYLAPSFKLKLNLTLFF